MRENGAGDFWNARNVTRLSTDSISPQPIWPLARDPLLTIYLCKGLLREAVRFNFLTRLIDSKIWSMWVGDYMKIRSTAPSPERSGGSESAGICQTSPAFTGAVPS